MTTLWDMAQHARDIEMKTEVDTNVGQSASDCGKLIRELCEHVSELKNRIASLELKLKEVK